MKSKIIKSLKDLIPYIVIILVVVLIRSYLVTPVMVSGTSMYPTLKGKEIMILNKLDKEYVRFEVVVLKTDHDDIIKRIIGLPGDTVSCEDGIIYINSRKIKDKYGYGITEDFEKVKLGKNEYFVLGDNRSNSLDSRYYGPFNINSIKGSTKFVLFPFTKMGNIE